MRLNEIEYTDALPVDGYGPGFFRIAGEVHEGPVLLAPDGVSPWNGPNDVEPLLSLSDKVDVIFVGTGADIAHLPEETRAAVDARGLGVEVMATPTAARTYNVLLSEGRRIALAMVPV